MDHHSNRAEGSGNLSSLVPKQLLQQKMQVLCSDGDAGNCFIYRKKNKNFFEKKSIARENIKSHTFS